MVVQPMNEDSDILPITMEEVGAAVGEFGPRRTRRRCRTGSPTRCGDCTSHAAYPPATHFQQGVADGERREFAKRWMMGPQATGSVILVSAIMFIEYCWEGIRKDYSRAFGDAVSFIELCRVYFSNGRCRHHIQIPIYRNTKKKKKNHCNDDTTGNRRIHTSQLFKEIKSVIFILKKLTLYWTIPRRLRLIKLYNTHKT